MANSASTPRPVLLVEDTPVHVTLTKRAFSRRKPANPQVELYWCALNAPPHSGWSRE